ARGVEMVALDPNRDPGDERPVAAQEIEAPVRPDIAARDVMALDLRQRAGLDAAIRAQNEGRERAVPRLLANGEKPPVGQGCQRLEPAIAGHALEAPVAEFAHDPPALQDLDPVV